jgi:hypothetical protein
MASLAPSSSLPFAAEVLLEAEALSGPQADLHARLREAEECYERANTEAKGPSSSRFPSLRSPSTGITSTTWYLGAMQNDIDNLRKQLGLKPIYSLSAVAEDNEDALNLRVSAAAPSPAPAPLQTGAGAGPVGPSVARTISSHGPGGDRWLADLGGWGVPALGRSMTGSLAAPPLVRVNAFRTAADSAAAAGDGVSSILALEDDAEVDALMDQLRTLRATLQIRQNKVYEEQAASHSDMALQDQEWNDLDTKIHAIEGVLGAFRQVYRTG